METQPPIFLLKPNDSLPLVDIVPSIGAAENHLTDHDQFDLGEGGEGVVDRSDDLYSDSVGNILQPRRTSDDRIELVLTGQQIGLGFLCNLAIQGFNALSVAGGAQSITLLTQGTPGNQELSEILTQLPSSHGLREILLPPSAESDPTDLLADIARRFMVPDEPEGTFDVRGSFLHNTWHIWKGICPTCRH